MEMNLNGDLRSDLKDIFSFFKENIYFIEEKDEQLLFSAKTERISFNIDAENETEEILNFLYSAFSPFELTQQFQNFKDRHSTNKILEPVLHTGFFQTIYEMIFKKNSKTIKNKMIPINFIYSRGAAHRCHTIYGNSLINLKFSFQKNGSQVDCSLGFTSHKNQEMTYKHTANSLEEKEEDIISYVFNGAFAEVIEREIPYFSKFIRYDFIAERKKAMFFAKILIDLYLKDKRYLFESAFNEKNQFSYILI